MMAAFGWFCVVVIATVLSFVSFASWALHSAFSNKRDGTLITVIYFVVAVIFWYLAWLYCPFTIVMV